MKYVDEFRDPLKAQALLREIKQLVARIDVCRRRPLSLMEVCGGHTHTIFKFGVETMLPDEVELVHGPGCPVCVLPMGRVDDCVALAETPGVIFTTFGDAMRVPGNTAGIGIIREGVNLGADRCGDGDAVLVNGLVGDHGAAILNARGDMALSTEIESDCAALHRLIAELLAAAPATRFIRDATRGGLATVLNEAARASGVGIEIWETATPIREEVKAFCEILGLDPLYLANEGKIVCVVPKDEEAAALQALRDHSLGRGAEMIGRVTRDSPGRVVMNTIFGGQRIVDMLVGDQLPRIC